MLLQGTRHDPLEKNAKEGGRQKTSLPHSDCRSEPPPMPPLIRTAPAALPQSRPMARTRLAQTLHFRTVSHKAACHTPPKAFLKPTKTWYRFCWCWSNPPHRTLRLKICSVAPPPAPNPARPPATTSPEFSSTAKSRTNSVSWVRKFSVFIHKNKHYDLS